MSLPKWLPCDFEQCHPLLWSGGILVDHWSTISSWIFISYHIFLLNQVEGAIAIPPSNSAHLPLLSVRLSVRLTVNRSVNHIFRFLHISWQVTGKEWHRVRNADVSRWLTLGQHWCQCCPKTVARSPNATYKWNGRLILAHWLAHFATMYFDRFFATWQLCVVWKNTPIP